MDRLLRNIDEQVFHALEERAISQGKRVEDVLNEAIRIWLLLPYELEKNRSLRDLPIVDLGPGTEHLSEEIDAVLYG